MRKIKMSNHVRSERDTQDRVVALLTDSNRPDHLGDTKLETLPGQANNCLRSVDLERNLERRRYSATKKTSSTSRSSAQYSC
jgi:hypothetical protein